MKNIFLTFDYELFLGEDSGSLENSILKPTDLLLDTLKECTAPATFYIDTIYIEKLLEHNLLDEYKLVKLQIQRMIKEGHRVELHLHPHWYDAIYIPETKRWKFPTYEHYRLHSYNETEIEHIFDKSVELLYNIVHEVDSNYKFYSYRAGGWCIQPFDKIKPSLEKHGIFVDSSSAYGMKSESIAHYFDFTNMPNKDIYKFYDNILEENQSGSFTEIASSVVSISVMFKILNKLLLKLIKYQIYGDGKGVDFNSTTVLSKFRRSKRILSIESISRFLINKLILQVKFNNVVLTSHPKFLSKESFEVIKVLAKKYQIITFKEI
jgi:hypothetical protein